MIANVGNGEVPAASLFEENPRTKRGSARHQDRSQHPRQRASRAAPGPTLPYGERGVPGLLLLKTPLQTTAAAGDLL